MKTKEEILYECLIEGKSERMRKFIRLVDHEEHLKAMDIYSAQEVERAKSETCKWSKCTPKEGNGWMAECDIENGIPFSNLIVMDYFNYCPFCGRKIERI